MAFVNDAGTTGKKTREERIQSLRNQAQKKKMDEKVRRNAEAFVKRREQAQRKQTVQQNRAEAQAPSVPSRPVAKKTAPAKTTASEPTRKTPLHGDDIPVSTWDEYYAKQKQKAQRRRLEMQNPREPVNKDASKLPVNQRGISQSDETKKRIFAAISKRWTKEKK